MNLVFTANRMLQSYLCEIMDTIITSLSDYQLIEAVSEREDKKDNYEFHGMIRIILFRKACHLHRPDREQYIHDRSDGHPKLQHIYPHRDDLFEFGQFLPVQQ